MKVLIVNPSRFYSGNWGGGELSHLFVLYSYLRKHCPEVEVDILDLERELSTPEDAPAELNFMRLARAALQASDFDIVGISCWTSLHYLSSVAVAKLCKELNPKCTVVVGGYHPTSVSQDFTYEGSPFDYVVLGEGEEAFRRIVTGEEPAKEKTARLVLGTKVDTAEQELYWEDYKYYRNTEKVQLWLTRGCPFSCGFCLDRNTKWRGYSPKKAIAEIRRVAKQLPTVRKISLMDPIFGLGKEWRREVLDGLIAADLDVRYWAETRGDILEEEDIERLGALDFQMDVGIDSVSPRMIGIMMKARHPDDYLKSFIETSRLMDKYKVTHLIYGIFNYPGETPATLAETRDFWLRYYEERPGGRGLFLSQPFAFFPGCEVYTNFRNYQQQYGAQVLCPEWWKIARPSHSKMATQVIPSRELADAKGLFQYKEIQKAINVLATKTVDKSVVEQFLLDVSMARPNVHPGAAYKDDKRLGIGDSSHYSALPNQRKVLFNFDREETKECTQEEAGWIERLLAGATPKSLREKDGERVEKFLNQMLARQYLKVLPGPSEKPDEAQLATRAVIETTLGAMEFKLLPDEAPHTVANFVRLARAGYYDRLPVGIAYRGAYIEPGSLMPRDPGPTRSVAADWSARLHDRGTLSMSPATNAAVFTVCRAPWPDLDGVRTVFGVMTAGATVLDRLVANDLILSVTIA